MNTILLARTSNGWTACYSGPHASEIQDLFGTKTIPTAFTAEADAQTVLAKIRALNPGVQVDIAR